MDGAAELGGTLPAVVAIARRHKEGMTAAIAGLLTASRNQGQDAQNLALAVDGAITRAHAEGSPKGVLASMNRIQNALQRSHKASP